MIAQALRGPHNLYRRYQGLLESTLTSVGLAFVVMLALLAIPAYPYNWIVVMVVAIAAVGIRWPLAAFGLAVGVMLYPIYTVNLYLAVLFLAISALGHRIMAHYLGATVLVLATPVLAQYHLHWLVPILAGLWWGTTGAWIGALAALWGKLLAGMAGMNLDWLVLAGHAPEVSAIISRFQNANSLDTLLLLIEPAADTSGVILYNLLQVIGWAAAGGLVGTLAKRKWVKYRTPWSILVVTAGGGLILLLTHLGLPYWLRDSITPETIAALRDPAGPLFSLLVVIIVGTTIYSLRESLELPVAPPQNLWTARRRQQKLRSRRDSQLVRIFRRGQALAGKGQNLRPGQSLEDSSRSHRPVSVPYTELPEWEPPQDEAGLIMLEID